MSSRSIALAGLLLVSIPSFADVQLGQFKDWQLRAVQWAAPLTDACVASVEAKIGTTTEAWHLHFILDKSGVTPPSLVVTTNSPVLPKALTAVTDGSSSKFRFYDLDLLDAATGEASFWLAPQDFTKLYTGIRRDSSFKVSYALPDGTKKSFHFSLSGSMKALDELEKQCASGQEIAAQDFHDELLKVKPDASTTVLPGGVAALWSGLASSYALFQQITRTETDLKVLQSRIDPLVKQQQKLLELSGKLSQDLVSKQAKQDILKKRNLTLDSELKSLLATRAAREQDLTVAQADFSKMEAFFKPVQQAMQPYSDAVSSASWAVNSAQSDVNGLISEISDAQQDIQSYKSQLSQLNSQLNSKNQDLNNLRAQRIQAQSALNSFDPQQELKKATNGDWQLQSWLNDLKQAHNSLQQNQGNLPLKQQDVTQLQSALGVCQQSPGVDCSALANQLSVSQNELSQLQSQIWQDQSRISSLESQIDSRTNQLEQQVSKQRQQLVDRVTQFDLAINQVSFEIITVQNRINQIQGQDIPDAEHRLTSAKLELGPAQSRLQVAKQDLAKAEKDLASFKIANAYEAKKTAYEQALAVVRAIQQDLASIDSGISTRDAEFKANAVSIAKLQLQIEQLVKDASANDSQLLALETQLTPLKNDKAAKTQLLSTATVQRATSDKAYKATLSDQDTGLGPLMPLHQLGPVFGDAKFWDWL